MLRSSLITCRYGCKYKGWNCLSTPQPLVAVQSEAYQASLGRCAQANKKEIEEQLLEEDDGQSAKPQCFVPRSGNRMNSIVRTGVYHA